MPYLKHLLVLIIIILTTFSVNGKRLIFDHITDQEGLDYTWVWDIIKDSEGFMWFSTQEGTFRYDGSNFKAFTFKSSTGVSNLNVYCTFEAKDSSIWFGTNEGLIHYQKKTNHYSRYRLDSIGNQASNQINAIVQDAKGNLWIGTNHGLFSYNRDLDDFSLYTASSGDRSLHSNMINALLIDSKQNLWVGCGDGSLYLYTAYHDHFKKYVNPSNPNHTTINTIYEDHQGYLWIGYNGA